MTDDNYKIREAPTETDIKLKSTFKVDAKTGTKKEEVKELNLKDNELVLDSSKEEVLAFVIKRVNIKNISKGNHLGSSKGGTYEIDNSKLSFYTVENERDVTPFVDGNKKTKFEIETNDYCTQLYWRYIIKKINDQELEKEAKFIMEKWSTKAVAGIIAIVLVLLSAALFAIYYFFIRNPEEETEEEINEEVETTHL